MRKVKVDKRVQKSKQRLLNYIAKLPKLEFTSGDITKFIAGRTTYFKAWEMIRTEGVITRVTAPRGTATGWKRSKAKTRK